MKQHNVSIPGLVAAAASAVGLAFYLVTSLTGYLAGSSMSAAVLVCSVLAVLLLAVLASGKTSGGVKDLVILAAGFLLIAGMIFFALGRVSLAADIYFIPVNYPASEETAFQLSVAGIAAYLVAIAADMTAAFTADSN